MNLSSAHYYHSPPSPLNSHLPPPPMTSSLLLLRRSPKSLTFHSSLFSTATATTPKPTSKPKTLNTYTLSTPTFTTKPIKPSFPKPSLVPFQPKVANSIRLTGHVAAPIHVTTENGAVWASTVLTSTAKSLRVSIVFEGELAHVAKLHVKDGDCVFVSGSLRSDLGHVSGGEMEAARLQVKVDTLNFVEESFLMKKRTKNDSDERRIDHTDERDDMSESLKYVQMWKDVLAKPHEWWDIRSKEDSPKASAFERKSNGELRVIDERKSNGELRVIDDSTPEWIQHKLDSITFDRKPMSHMSDTSSTSRADGDSTVGTWKDLLDNSNQWKDYRSQKLDKLVKEKHPEFKRKDGSHALWLNKAPDWVLQELKGKEFEVPDLKSKQANEGDKSWRNLVENPDKWWDNRLQKRNTKAPDFKHKETGEALWLNSSPGWAIPMLPPLKTQQIATN